MNESIVEYATSQPALVVIAIMGLAVAGLALWFGICITKYLMRNQK